MKKKEYKIGKTGRLGGKRWKFDSDFMEDLSPEDRKYYTAFLEEYYAANFKHPGKKLIRGKRKQREIYGLNNAANRCIMGLTGSKTDQVSSGVENLLDTKNIKSDSYEIMLNTLLDESEKSRK